MKLKRVASERGEDAHTEKAANDATKDPKASQGVSQPATFGIMDTFAHNLMQSSWLNVPLLGTSPPATRPQRAQDDAPLADVRRRLEYQGASPFSVTLESGVSVS